MLVEQEGGGGLLVEQEGGGGLLVLTYYNKLVNTLNAIPNNIYNATIDSATAISDSIQRYADTMSGKNDIHDDDVDTLMIEKVHMDYMDALRKRDMPAYTALVKYCEEIIESNLSYKQQGVVFATYVKEDIERLRSS